MIGPIKPTLIINPAWEWRWIKKKQKSNKKSKFLFLEKSVSMAFGKGNFLKNVIKVE